MSWLEPKIEAHEKLVQAINDFLEDKTQELPNLGQGNFERQAYKYALAVHTAADAIDSILEKNIKTAEKKGTSVTCTAGCSYCCSQPVGIQFPEVFHIAEYLSQNTDKKERFLKKYPSWRKNIDLTSYEMLMNAVMTGKIPPKMAGIESAVKNFYKHDILPCPFLENNLCEIYPARPFVCRKHYALSDPENCRNNSKTAYAIFGDLDLLDTRIAPVMVHIMKNLGIDALAMCNAPLTVRAFLANGKDYVDFYAKSASEKLLRQNL